MKGKQQPSNKISEAQKQATKRYIERKGLVETKFRTTREEKEYFQSHAKQMGESLNGFIIRAIDETIEHDNKKLASAASIEREE